MKTMTVANSVIIKTALILLQLCCSDARICREGRRPEKYTKMCPQGHMDTSNGNLPCEQIECDDNQQRCELSGRNKVNSTLIKFTPQMCLTDDPSSASYVGFNFSWTLPAGEAEVTGLNILLEHKDYQQSWILHKVNLTGHMNNENEKNFSTDCLASNSLSQGKNYYISVQVLPGEEQYRFPQPFTYNPDCSRPSLKERTLCGDPPWRRPIAESFCNGTVAVTANAGFPSGITTETEFQIRVILCDVPDGKNCEKQDKTVQVVFADIEEPKLYFNGLEPGIYGAKMAFLDEYGIPCGNNFYLQEGNTTVNHPPAISLEADSLICNRTIEVIISASSFKRTSDRQFNIEVILSGTGDQDLTKTVLVTTNLSDAEDGKTKVYFDKVQPGNYTVTTKFVDQYYQQCSSDETTDVIVSDFCETSVKFWDVYGKLILGVGVLSLVSAGVVYVVHQRWIMKKRRITEQQQSLTEDRGSSVDHQSSIADTTVQESHMHRFLNDASQAWSNQHDGYFTELTYKHQPMSADSGIPSDDPETQSWPENESMAFSV